MSSPQLSPQHVRLEEARELAAELSKLSKEHATAVRNATFMGMTEAETRAFDERRKRISEICARLSKLKASDLKPPER